MCKAGAFLCWLLVLASGSLSWVMKRVGTKVWVLLTPGDVWLAVVCGSLLCLVLFRYKT